MTQTDSNREAFEKWAMMDGFSVIQDGKKTYERCACQDCWEAWQAATAQALRPISRLLYPNGIKHPQQLEPEWIAEDVRSRLEECDLLRLLVETEKPDNPSVPLDEVKKYLDGA